MLHNMGSSLPHLLFSLVIISSVFSDLHGIAASQEKATAQGEVCEISKSHLLEQMRGMCISHCSQSLMLLLSDVIFLHGQMNFVNP